MKKKLFLLTISVVTMLASCSHDAIDGLTPAIISKKSYPIQFSASAFKADTTPLTKASQEEYYFQYMIYKEDGTFVKTKSKVENTQTPGKMQFNDELPLGKYILAVLYTVRAQEKPFGEDGLTNFDTDYFYGNVMGDKVHPDNVNVYYNYKTFTIVAGENTVDPMVLNPMWSTINATISDSKTCSLPSGTTHLRFEISPYYYGFSLKSKVASKTAATTWYQADVWQTVNDFRTSGVLLPTNVNGGANTIVKLQFVKFEGTYPATVLGEKSIYENKTIELGQKYNLTGNIGNSVGETPTSFDVQIGQLVDKNESFE